MATIDLSKLLSGYRPEDYGYTFNNDGSKPGGWYKGGAESASNPYGGGSEFEAYLAKSGVGMWDPGNPGYGRVGMSNQEAFNGLYPGATMLGTGSSVAGSDPGLAGTQFFTTPNGASPNEQFFNANINGKDFGDHSGINGVMEKFGPMIPFLVLGGAMFLTGSLAEVGAGQVIGDLSGMGAGDFVTADMVNEAVASGTLTAEEGAAAMEAIGGGAAAAGAGAAGGLVNSAQTALSAGEGALEGDAAATTADAGSKLAAEQTGNIGANAADSAIQQNAKGLINSGLDEFNNPINMSGAQPASPADIARQTASAASPGLPNTPPGLIDRALKWAKENQQLASGVVQGVGSIVGGAAKAIGDNQTMKTKAQLDLENKQKLIAYYRDFVQGGSAGGIGVNMGGQAPANTPALTRPGGAPVYGANGRLN